MFGMIIALILQLFIESSLLVRTRTTRAQLCIEQHLLHNYYNKTTTVIDLQFGLSTLLHRNSIYFLFSSSTLLKRM